MSDVSEQGQTEEVPVMSGPGHRLREAREARRLTLEQAAAQLRMQVRIIQALENDDYSGLPGSTFVQGYLRSYSRLLGLPEESILALAQPSTNREPILVSTIADGKAEVSSRDLPFRMITLLVFIAMVVGMGWWLSQRDLSLQATSPVAEQSSGGEQGLWLPEEQVRLHGDPESLSAGADGDSAGGQDEDAGNGATDGEDEVTQEEVSALEDGVSQEQSVPPVSEEPRPVVMVAAEMSPPALTAEMPQSLLELEYQADSWSEVSDAAGRKLAYGLISAGQKLKLRGEAPFRVFLGFATGVTVYYNGALYDHRPFQRGDVARFRIGKAEHNSPVSGN